MKWFYAIALIVVVVLAGAPFALLPKQNTNAYQGKVVLRDSYGSPIKSIDPATCGDTGSASIQSNVFEGLYNYHFLIRPVKVVPLLAADMPEISADRLTYTIRLRPDVYYHRNPCFGAEEHEGKTRHKTRLVRAEDFILALKRCADFQVNAGLSWAFLSGHIVGLDEWREKTKKYKVGDFSRYDLPVSGLSAPDPLTLKITLNEPYPRLTDVLARCNYAPIPREAVDYWLGAEDDGAGGRRPIPVEKRATEFREAVQCVGTGPYMLTTFDRKRQIVETRNPEYRPDFYPTEGTAEDKANGLLDDAGKRVPFIDVMDLQFVAETYPSWMRFLYNKTDRAGIPQEAFDSVISPDRKLAAKWRERGIRLMKYGQPTIQWVVFNMRDKILGASKSLRQALCLSFDVENEIKVLWNGRGVRAVTIIPRSMMPTWKEAGPGPYYRYDVQAAKAKLVEARKELAAKGLLVNGEIPTLTMNLGGTGQQTIRFGEFCKQQFAQIGVKLKVENSDFPVLLSKVNSKLVQMYQMGWHADYPDPENFLQIFYSPNITKGTNDSNYHNPEFDRLYEQAYTMPDTPERRKLYIRMMHLVCEDCPVLPLSEPTSFLLLHDWVRNVKPNPYGYGYLKYEAIDVKLRRQQEKED